MMTLYSLTVFLHVIGAVGVFVALSFERLILFKLQRSNSQFSEWKSVTMLPTKIGAPSLGISLLTGIYLMVAGPNQMPWVWYSLAALVLIAIVGASLTGPALQTIRKSNTPPSFGPLWGKLWFSLQMRTGLIVGILFLMVIKPGPDIAIASLIVSVVIFSLPVFFFARKYHHLRAKGAT